MQRKNNRLQSDLLLWIGVLLCSIPLLTGWYSQKKTQNVLATYEQIVEQTTGDEIEQLRIRLMNIIKSFGQNRKESGNKASLTRWKSMKVC
ncbi:hypothetical protein DW977_02980 [Ruminococcus sp. AM49-10BH]|nr:hypothetical protein DW977_02980 [Ruminococcus sp. AM49-10BH]